MKISVIVPVYNCDKYISKCIESILCQSYTNLELLMINDGSVDRSAEIIKTFQLKDNRLKYFEKSNSGVSAARNLGIDNATGDYVLFVDGDDWLDDNVLEVLAQEAVSNNADCVSYNSRVVYEDGKSEVTIHGYSRLCYTFSNSREASNFINIEGRPFFYSACRHLFKNELLRHYHIRFFEDVKIAEDTSFCHLFMLFVKNGVLCPELVGYNYLQHQSSATHTHIDYWNDVVKEYFKRCQELHNFLTSYNLMKIGRDELSNLSWECIIRLAETSLKLPRQDFFSRYKHSVCMKSIIIPSILKYGPLRRKILVCFFMCSQRIFSKILNIK